MSFKRITEKELEFIEKAGVTLGEIAVIKYIREAHAEIDRLNEQARQHGRDFYDWREKWESARRKEEQN